MEIIIEPHLINAGLESKLRKIVEEAKKKIKFQQKTYKDYELLIRRGPDANEKPCYYRPGYIFWKDQKIIINLSNPRIRYKSRTKRFNEDTLNKVLEHEFLHLKDAADYQDFLKKLETGISLTIIPELLWEMTINKRLSIDWGDRAQDHVKNNIYPWLYQALQKEDIVKAFGKIADEIMVSKKYNISEIIFELDQKLKKHKTQKEVNKLYPEVEKNLISIL